MDMFAVLGDKVSRSILANDPYFPDNFGIVHATLLKNCLWVCVKALKVSSIH
jgi:hypothetical protein